MKVRLQMCCRGIRILVLSARLLKSLLSTELPVFFTPSQCKPMHMPGIICTALGRVRNGLRPACAP